MLDNPQVKPYQVNNMLLKLSKVLENQDITDLTSATVDFYIRQLHKEVDPKSLVRFLEFAISRNYVLSQDDLDGFRLYLIKKKMAHKEIGKIALLLLKKLLFTKKIF